MEKLEFINVVTIDTGVIVTINTFPFPSTNIPAQQETAKAAEDYFTELVKGIDDKLTDEQVNEYLEDGTYIEAQHTPFGGREVHIIWSENTASAAKKQE